MVKKQQFCPVAFLKYLIDKLSTDELSINDKLDPVKDVSEGLKKVLEEYKQAKEFDLREVGDYLYDGIYVADGDGKTLYVNKAYVEMTGINPEEVINKYVTDCEKEGLYKNAVTPLVIKYRKQVNSVGESLRNGKKMLITGTPIFDEDGQVKKVVVIDRDITNLLAMKAELEATQEKIKAVEEDKHKKKQEIEHLRKLHLNKNFIGQSPEAQQIIKMVHQVATLDVTVLITGETGTGKEVVTNEIYLNSARKNEPFIKVNCAAIPANLLEAELFGYEKGAFTGAANTGRIGVFELANKGTLLLDEIGEMPLELQPKLLRVLQNKEITRIGGKKPIKLDVRIIAATNRDLKELVRQGRFRGDLYYRLNIFPIHIPPLRVRTTDIELLTQYFLSIYNGRYAKYIEIEQPAIELLKQYPWPGNVRELQNIIERLVIISEPRAVIKADLIGNLLNLDHYHTEFPNKESSLREIVRNAEKNAIKKALAIGGSTRKAAQILKIDQSTIVKKVKKLGITLSDEKCHQT
ncbi:sigma-54 interaction domain-containing protein [Sporolituus thermophilus]|uniref:HTH-type transcriptional regulatory protein TyrR n=1 Tax=Sporolituus thermophilus DSM 23256 TaxID=1123285 RepID=A0A1G7IP71_9FIRM|nr:sigma 54-interacting transcriptional regulator [Sporolituus thermophilus]SDF14378.1 PAS domain S-box-containing protein [Sporolituus thermophilus DSM 23256]